MADNRFFSSQAPNFSLKSCCFTLCMFLHAHLLLARSCLLTTDRNVSPDYACEVQAVIEHRHRCRCDKTQLPHTDVDRTRTYLQLSLLHSSCLTRFYPSRIPDTGWESFLSAFPSSLMPVLCLHPKHSSSTHNQRWILGAFHRKKNVFKKKKKLSQQGSGAKFYL